MLLFFFSVELEADLKTGSVNVKQLGANSSALDGIEMIKDRVYSMKPSSTLHILTGSFPQNLKMEPVASAEDNKERSKSASEMNRKSSSTETSNKDRKRHESDHAVHRSSHRSTEEKHRDKSSDKKRSLDGASSDVPLKKAKYDSDSVSSNKEHKSSDKKRPSSSSDETVFKRPKLSDESSESKKSSSSLENEDQYVSDVSAKLALLKSKGKTVKTPTKEPHGSTHEAKHDNGIIKKSKERSPSSSSGNSVSRKGAALESKWEQFDSLYVYTTKGLESRSKVRNKTSPNNFLFPDIVNSVYNEHHVASK